MNPLNVQSRQSIINDFEEDLWDNPSSTDVDVIHPLGSALFKKEQASQTNWDDGMMLMMMMMENDAICQREYHRDPILHKR